MKKKLFALCCKFYQYTFKKNNHHLADVKLNRNMSYYYLKWRDKSTMSDIWYKSLACMCQISNFLRYLKLRFVRESRPRLLVRLSLPITIASYAEGGAITRNLVSTPLLYYKANAKMWIPPKKRLAKLNK